MLDSNLCPPKAKKFAHSCRNASSGRFTYCVPPLHRLTTNTRIFQPEEMESRIILPPSLLTHLSEEVLVLILEYLDFRSLVMLGKTCRLFHRLCLSNLIWRHRCRVSEWYFWTILLVYTKQVIVLVFSSFRFKFLCYSTGFGLSEQARERHPYLMTVMGCEILVYKPFAFPFIERNIFVKKLILRLFSCVSVKKYTEKSRTRVPRRRSPFPFVVFALK